MKYRSQQNLRAGLAGGMKRRKGGTDLQSSPASLRGWLQTESPHYGTHRRGAALCWDLGSPFAHQQAQHGLGISMLPSTICFNKERR